jgi:hypothetical protein
MMAHSAEVRPVHGYTQVSIDDGHVLHPAVGSGPEVYGIEAGLTANASVRCEGELNGEAFNANLLPSQGYCSQPDSPPLKGMKPHAAAAAGKSATKMMHALILARVLEAISSIILHGTGHPLCTPSNEARVSMVCMLPV